MATSTRAVRRAPASGLEEANLFELRNGRTTISYTTHNITGEPVVIYNDGTTTHTFQGDEIRFQVAELGTLVTVTLAVVIDLETRLLTLVLPQVQVKKGMPEKVSVPVVFTRIAMSIAGPPLEPGPVQTYDVKIYSGTASFVVS